MANQLDLTPLSSALGAEATGVDSVGDLLQIAGQDLQHALDAHRLLLFRDLEIEATEQVELLERYGSVLIENRDGRAFQFVANEQPGGILGDAEYAFHSDHAFMAEPIDVISLYAIEIPPVGGRTRFANAVNAATQLPASLLRSVEGRRARHIIDPTGDPAAVRLRDEKLPDSMPHAWHPVLMPHPRTGETILYASQQQTDAIEGLPEEESAAVIAALFEHLYHEKNVFEHTWHVGDLILWDNRALQHARDPLDSQASRVLRRVSVGGTSVIEFFERYEGPMSSRPAEPVS